MSLSVLFSIVDNVAEFLDRKSRERAVQKQIIDEFRTLNHAVSGAGGDSLIDICGHGDLRCLYSWVAPQSVPAVAVAVYANGQSFWRPFDPHDDYRFSDEDDLEPWSTDFERSGLAEKVRDILRGHKQIIMSQDCSIDPVPAHDGPAAP